MVTIPEAFTTLALGAVGALMGAILLWKFWALPKIRGWVFEQGSAKLKQYVDQIIEDPESEEAKRIGQFAGVAFAYIVQGLQMQLSTPEGREAWKPIFEVVKEHIMNSVFGAWGAIMKNLQNEGQAGGLPQGLSIPAPIAGLAQRIFPGIDPSQILGMVNWLSSISGGKIGLGGSPLSGPTAGNRGNGGKGEA